MSKEIEYGENCTAILHDINGLNIREGFYFDKTPPISNLTYVSLDKKVYLWVIERHNEKPEDSAYLTEDNAKNLERVVNSEGWMKHLKSELKFMRKKASEFFPEF